MKNLIKLAVFGWVTLSLFACGGSGGGSPSTNQKYHVVASKDKGFAEIFLEPVDQGSSDTGSPDHKVDATSPVNRQTLVSGKVSIENYSSGNITVSGLVAQTCQQGYCPDESKLPLASTILSKDGYFSLVVPSGGEAVIVKATYQSSTGSSLSAQQYLGVLDHRVDDIALALK